MKVRKLGLLFIMLLIPLSVEAKESCKVVSGNGKDLGSEIACGSEHFYVIESNEDEVKMLAKYNLNTGVTIYKEKIEKEEGDTRSDSKYCFDLAQSKGGTVKSDDFYNAPGYCFYAVLNSKETIIDQVLQFPFSDTRSTSEICSEFAQNHQGVYIESSQTANPYYREIECKYKKINDSYNLLQTEDAKSAHWDEELNYLYPQVGDVYMQHTGEAFNNDMNFEEGISKKSIPVQENTSFYDFDINLDHLNEDTVDSVMRDGNQSGITKPLYTYKYLLEQMGYTINDISLLSLSEMDGIVNKTSGKFLPLEEWGTSFNTIQFSHDYPSTYKIEFGDLKPYIPNDYSWLYSTTYWNSTVFDAKEAARKSYFVFTAEQGKLCGAGFLTCAPETTLGCGVRPVITIPTSEIEYNIQTKTDGNGEIEVVENAKGNDKITFKITSKKGYQLSKLTITTDSGERVEFSKGEIINNSDGTISINQNKFTMPFENVVIEASFEQEKEKTNNPDTLDFIIYVHIFYYLCLGVWLISYTTLKHRLGK